MGTEPSAILALAILNGLDISSLSALSDLSTGASTKVIIPWPPAGMEQATPEWRQRASEAIAFLLGSRNGERYSNWGSALKQPNAASIYQTQPHAGGYGLPKCTTARCAGCWMGSSQHGLQGHDSRMT